MRKIVSLLISISIAMLATGLVRAQERVESNNYRIQFPNLNSGAGIPSSTNYSLDTTIGQNAPGLYSSTGYRVKAGFQYIHSIIPFSFAVSDIRRNFGTLTPGTPSTLASTLTVSAGGAGGYSVKASENHPLQIINSSTNIADTTCDLGGCSQTAGTAWVLTSTYGFGFNMIGDDVPADFVNSTYFRQFADRSSAESEQTVMSSANVGRSRSATITYKVNVSSIQEAGSYQNIITYTAIPSY